MRVVSPRCQARPEPETTTDGLDAPKLSESAFRRITAIAHREAGLAIGGNKSAMVRTRLSRRLRALGLGSFEAYCDHLEAPEGHGEIAMLISSLTTNVSHFFREGHHFDTLQSQVLPPLTARAKAGGRVRIWSAGCANGQEPYSIAMAMCDAGMPFERDVKILATDIDPHVVARARAGFFPETMLSGLPDALRARHFTQVSRDRETGWQISDELRSTISFRELNLLETWPMRGPFDAIFCRNVVIYFDAATQDRLWHRFAQHLAPGGWMFIGHSERLSAGAQNLFSGRGITTYRKTDAPDPPRAVGRASHKGFYPWHCGTN